MDLNLYKNGGLIFAGLEKVTTVAVVKDEEEGQEDQDPRTRMTRQ